MGDTDLKKTLRRGKVFLLHMQNFTKAEIAAKLGISESTVDRDLALAQSEIKNEGNDYNEIVNEAMMGLRSTKFLLLETYESAADKQWTQARILSMMADIDKTILLRFMNPKGETGNVNIQLIKQEAIFVSAFIAKNHPELLSEFKQYVLTQRDKPQIIDAEAKP